MSDEQTTFAAIYLGVQLASEQLTLQELGAIYRAALTDADPTTLSGYDRARHLFDADGGRKMHSMTKQVLGIVFRERLKAEEHNK